MEIDENSTGNIEVMEAISKELHLDQDDMEYTKYIAGDQLTIVQLSALASE